MEYFTVREEDLEGGRGARIAARVSFRMATKANAAALLPCPSAHLFNTNQLSHRVRGIVNRRMTVNMATCTTTRNG